MSFYKVNHTVEDIRMDIVEHINQSNKAPVLICNSHITGLAVARALGKEGVPILALDREEKGLAFASKYVKVRGVCPNPVEEEEAFIQFLLDLGSAFEKKCILFPCMDEWALTLAKHAESLSEYYIWNFSDYESINRILDKSKLYTQAEKLGVPIPKYQKIDIHNATQIAQAFSFPLVLKPIEKRTFYDRFDEALFIVKSKEELLDKLNKAKDIQLVAQEQVPSTKGCYVTVVAYMDRNQKIRGSLVGRRLEIYPPESGTTCLVESIDEPDLINRAIQVLQEFNYHGIAECEFMYDSRDGEYKLLDLNTRPWKWIGLPIQCNVNLPYLMYRDAVHDPYTTERGTVGKKWVYVQDYIALKEAGQGIYENDLLSKEEWIHILTSQTDDSGLITTAIESADDPEPSYQQLQNKFSERKYYCPC